MIKKTFRFEGYYTSLDFVKHDDGVISIKRYESVNPILLKTDEAHELKIILTELLEEKNG